MTSALLQNKCEKQSFTRDNLKFDAFQIWMQRESGKIDTANDFFEAMRGILPGSSRDSHNDSQQRSY